MLPTGSVPQRPFHQQFAFVTDGARGPGSRLVRSFPHEGPGGGGKATRSPGAELYRLRQAAGASWASRSRLPVLQIYSDFLFPTPSPDVCSPGPRSSVPCSCAGTTVACSWLPGGKDRPWNQTVYTRESYPCFIPLWLYFGVHGLKPTRPQSTHPPPDPHQPRRPQRTWRPHGYGTWRPRRSRRSRRPR